MPYLQVSDTQFPLRTGDVTVGTGAASEIRLEGPESLGVQAVVQLGANNQVTVRRASPAAVVRVNGVQLGLEPSPLIHGDKLEIAGRELTFGDDRKAGSTRFLSDLDIPAILGQAPQRPAKPTSTTGGRLVSLVDGREYTVGATGLTIGRDAGCDVVVPSGEVSRRHAGIAPGAGGYVLTDTSSNGVFVNGERVPQSQVLGRGDVVRVGNEEFRFYADVVSASDAAAPAEVAVPQLNPTLAMPTVRSGTAAAAPPAPPAVPTIPAVPAAPVTPAPSPGAARAPAPPPSAAPAPASPKPPSAPAAPKSPASPAPPAAPKAPAPAVPKPATAAPSFASPAAAPAVGAPRTSAAAPEHVAPRPALASLEIVNEGILKGRRFEITTALAHVGRGAHNDVAVSDASVSDSHAKLQRRDDGWYVVDMGSTNGTYVGGRRVTDEHRLEDGQDVRFGGVKLVFRAGAGPATGAKGTQVITGASLEQARRATADAAARPAAGRPAGPADRTIETPPAPEGGASRWLLIAVLLLAGAVAYFLLKAR
jgi:pSer/pThr/pTyr-binding forkhead associated (FHA) protein